MIATGCKKERIANQVEGLWDLNSSHSLSYHDGVLVSDVTETTGLGQFYFGDDETGWATYYANDDPLTFEWEVDHKNDALTITYTIEPSAPDEPKSYPILELDDDRMVIKEISTHNTGTSIPQVVVHNESTFTLERAAE